jgi:hypothetical protein
MPSHDFGDGNGPVPAHQHLVPGTTLLGGWVAETATVDPHCFVMGSAQGPASVVYGNAVVSGPVVIVNGGAVFGNAVVDGGSGTVISGQVYEGAHVSGPVVLSGSGKIHGQASVSGDVFVAGEVYDNAVIVGPAPPAVIDS